MKVTIVRNQGKSISNIQFDTKKEAVFYINSLPNPKTIRRIRSERRYIVGIT